MKILITGASGNLGAKLVVGIHSLGEECAVLLRPTSVVSNEVSELTNLATLRPSSQGEMARLIRTFDPDVIVHAACNYGSNGESYAEISSANIDLGLSIINSLNFQSHLKTFININTALPSELSDYARSKHYFSKLCQELASRSSGKFQFVNLITQTIYGGRLTQSGFIAYIIGECLSSKKDLKLTLGNQKRDFIHADDVVNAIKTIILNIDNKLEGEYDLGSGVSRSIREVVTLIHSLSKSKINLVFGALPYRVGEPMDLVADISKLNSLGWMPAASFEEDLQGIILRQIKDASTPP